ncbi:MAG TPA: M20/M25/M40 family metallo-hydrolase [Vicinamibacterales bacterium]|jgi:carboxypeptidase Q|nr:M20/M25/M40 family metallo-hydrolase [Vicinamibacterales bacterium]
MHTRRTIALAALIAGSLGLPLAAQWPSNEKVDLDAVYRIKDEALTPQRSKVMEIESYLTDVYGPRLTGSPDLKEAADWAEKTMKEWGLANVHTEPYPFGRGWQNERFTANAISPRAYPLIAFPKAWTPGTQGPVTADAVMAVITSDKDFDTYRGTLKGKFVLTQPVREVEAHFDALGHRLSADDLAALEQQPAARGRGRGNFAAQQEFARRRTAFFVEEGVAAVLEPSTRGDGGTIFVQAGGSRDPKEPPHPPEVVVAIEHYGRIARTLEKHLPVKLQLDIENRFYDADTNAFNITAEIPGTDKADELVMLGAHFDSWHSGTGATDNAAGSAVMMEAMRILKESGLKLRRTVRLGLWTGEEEGLLGSKAYVKAHFADPATMRLLPEHAKLSGYYNVDNGTGAIRGVYLQGNEAVAPIFSAWMEPFRNMGMTTLAIRNTGGTDHLSYDAVGLPGFQFVQDPVEYDTRTHHSSQDVYERIQAQDMMQNAAIVATFVYDTANRDEKLPRKPLPKPQVPGRTSVANQ